MNNGWCFSRPKLAHAQPEIYLKNHVNTPMQPFHVATHETQWHSWCTDFSLEKKKTPLHVAHTAWWLSVARPCVAPPHAIHDHQPRYVFWAKVQTAKFSPLQSYIFPTQSLSFHLFSSVFSITNVELKRE